MVFIHFLNLQNYSDRKFFTPAKTTLNSPMSPKKLTPNLSSLPRESLVESINELYKELPEAKFLIDLRSGGSATPLVKKFKKRIANQLAIGIEDELTIGLLDARESLNEFSGFSPPVIWLM